MQRPIHWLGVGLLLLAVSGCGGFNFEKSYDDVDINHPVPILDIPAAGAEQKVNVTVTAGKPVSAYLYLKENETDVENRIGTVKGPKADQLLGSQTESAEINFEATVPAKKAYKLYVYVPMGSRTTVKVKVQAR